LIETKRVALETRMRAVAIKRAGGQDPDLKTVKRRRREVDFGAHAEGYQE
jgi:hypothetical protein